MAFNSDNGGFPFKCDDAKFSICASTWNTKLSQIGRLKGEIYIMTNLLIDIDYISSIISKRPNNISIIADEAARENALLLKAKYPNIRIALHPHMNAKVVLIEPKTIWVSSSDFGKSNKLESAIGLHSSSTLKRVKESFFNAEWEKAKEI